MASSKAQRTDERTFSLRSNVRTSVAPIFALVAFLIAPDVNAADKADPVFIVWTETHQTIVGFGGTMGWIHPHPEQRDEVFDLLFKDLGASVLRVQALGGEGGDEVTPEKENDNNDPDTFDWSKFSFKETEAKAALNIKSAQSRGVKLILPVTWSPPGWMKDNGKRTGTSAMLKPEMADEFAELWAAYVIAMKRDFGIEIHDICIQNEPDLTWYYPTCRIDAGLLARTMLATRKKLEHEKLDVRVLGPDTCRIYHLAEYAEQMEKWKSSPGTPLLTHLYDLDIGFEEVEKDAPRWNAARVLVEKYKRPLWLVETANYLSGVDPASYSEALLWAQKIHWALCAGDCEMVCYWQLFFDKKGEALIYCAKSEDKKYEITPKFYTSKNFFKFVRPGMVRVSAATTGKDVLVSAFDDPAAKDHRVIVLINTAKEARTVSFTETGAWQRFTTAVDRKCVDDGTLKSLETIALPAQSVTTLVAVATER